MSDQHEIWLIEALDILASVAVYLGVTSLENVFESHQFQKAAFLLTVIHIVLIVSCAAAGSCAAGGNYQVPGRFAFQAFVTRGVTRAR